MPKEFDPLVTAFVRAKLPAALNPMLSLKKQAEGIGVSDAMLHAVLNGGAVGKKTLPLFAAALGMSVEELISAAHKGQAPTAATPTIASEAPRGNRALRSRAIETLLRQDKALTLERVEHHVDWVLNEPPRQDGASELTLRRAVALAQALLAAEDGPRSSRPPSHGPVGPATRHTIRNRQAK
jgi:hypothetical protein